MLAHALFQGGDRLPALQAAGEALRLWLLAENRYGVARARAALGIFAVLRGEFETAHCNYAIARPLFRDIGDRDDEASVLNGLGYVNRATGDWQKSVEYYQAARAVFAAVQDLPGEHDSISGMGEALAVAKNYKRLLPLYQADLRLGRRANDPVVVASAFAHIAMLTKQKAGLPKPKLFIAVRSKPTVRWITSTVRSTL